MMTSILEADADVGIHEIVESIVTMSIPAQISVVIVEIMLAVFENTSVFDESHCGFNSNRQFIEFGFVWLRSEYDQYPSNSMQL
jgi:hypothetical protein